MDRVSQAAPGENNFLVTVNSKFKSRGLFEIFKAGTEARWLEQSQGGNRLWLLDGLKAGAGMRSSRY